MSSISMLFLGASLLLVGCAGASQAATPPAIRTLAKGAFSAIQQPTEQVITDKIAWEKAWTEHCSGKSSEKLPEVDFTTEMVVAVTMGRKTSGGYSIQVKQVEPAGGKLRI